jgi:hypothetical protein
VGEITDTVTFMRQASQEGRGQAPYGQLEMEAVIRAALGETDVDLSGISRQTIFEIQLAIVGFIALKLDLGEDEIDRLIVEAEGITFKRGWHPQFAD